ncbi:lipopolysaccharide assembly protein LapA domain-containing protein [Pseudomonas corrugata]|uniref:lipopolysaccharide assembly protein LapA domain-containing protein n=1 Tax=Pseudomonas corrugata TaxID=47879 RepID=UPI002231A83C|nr:LapA family protein [Pseudomonas corrugata]UZD97146.1 lipopolysaccharide assembly protein LapA domain-containing protein [Pseudomonas corrugata]
MRSVKRFLVIPFIFTLAALVVCFILENRQTVNLQFFGWAAPSLPIAVLMLSALLIGLALGPLLAIYTVLRAKRRKSIA